jgi:hypothetical protein
LFADFVTLLTITAKMTTLKNRSCYLERECFECGMTQCYDCADEYDIFKVLEMIVLCDTRLVRNTAKIGKVKTGSCVGCVNLVFVNFMVKSARNII